MAYFTDYEFYEYVTNKLDLHRPNPDKFMDYAELLDIEYDEDKGLFIKP
jgi:hypothetical protein